MKKYFILIPILFLLISMASAQKITLTPAMVSKANGGGDVSGLVDNQQAVDHPAQDATGVPGQIWNPDWTGAPFYATIDLGQQYALNTIYMLDAHGIGNVLVHGSLDATSWMHLFTDDMDQFLKWQKHIVTANARYIRMTLPAGVLVGEIMLYGTPAGDVTAPSAVSNFSAGSATSSSVTLNWNAAGDDGNVGTASSYAIRYSTAPITDINFASATLVTGVPSPAISGTAQSVVVSGLAASTTYYFGIKVSDEVPLTSPLATASLTTTSGGSQTPQLLVITDNMITKEYTETVGFTSPLNLFDELDKIGDPLHDAGGLTPNTQWFPGWQTSYPATFYVNLGSNYVITHIYLLDGNGSGDWEVLTGSPGSWTSKLIDHTTGQLGWNKHVITNGETQYLRIKRYSTGGDVKAMAIYGYPGAPDATPPATIADLSSVRASATSVILKWTAPGDDGNAGIAAQYDVRHSTSLITNLNFANATTATGIPAPSIPGTQEFFTVTGLSPNTTYYFAVKTKDEVTFGSLSNVTSKATPSVVNTARSAITIDQFLGTNAFVDDRINDMKCVGFIREYHNWNWDEGDIWSGGGNAAYPRYPNNAIKWAPSEAGGGSWNFDTFYTDALAAGLTISPCIQGSVKWLHGGLNFPDNAKPIDTPTSSTTSPHSYHAKAHHMFQFAARYGNRTVSHDSLTLAPLQPVRSGIQKIKYIEDWNEQNKDWLTAAEKFSASEYAAMCSADYDGHGKTLTGGKGTFGVKNADRSMKLVMGGLYFPDTTFLREMNKWFLQNRSDYKFAADVINVHWYAWKNGKDANGGGPALSPEEDDFEGKMKKIVDFRDQNLDPETEVWISEFGWDTHPASALRVPVISGFDAQEIQAQWLVRAFLAFSAVGVDRAMQFMLRDENPNDATPFSTCGLMGPKDDWTPKKSWYYVYTMKNTLSGMRFMGKVNTQNQNVRVYKFKNVSGNNGVYVLWCPTKNNTTVNYSLQLNSPGTVTKIVMTTGDQDGVSSTVTPAADGKVLINVSERPVFIQVDNIN